MAKCDTNAWRSNAPARIPCHGDDVLRGSHRRTQLYSQGYKQPIEECGDFISVARGDPMR